MCETDIVKPSDIKSLLLKQCDQYINEKKDPHTNLCKLAYKNSPYSELYAVLLKLWSQNALILNGTDAFESKMGLNSNNKCG